MGDSQGEAVDHDAADVLIVGAGPFQVGLVNAVRDLGLRSVAVDRSLDAPGMKLADHAYPVDVCDEQGVLEVARRHRVRGALTAASDAALPAVAYVTEHLKLTGPSGDDVWRCNDKLLTHAALESAGVAVPRTKLARSLEEASAYVRDARWERIVIKPRRGAGGRGVSVCERSDDIRDAFDKASKYVDRGEGLLLQECVEGTPVGLEACFFRGRLIRGFVMDDQFETGFVSPVGHSLPSCLPATAQRGILHQCEIAASALGLRDGPANFDLRLRGRETVVLEVNPRLGGNSISELVDIAYGVKLYRAAVLVALGADPSEVLTPVTERSAATRLLISKHRGGVRIVDALPHGFEAFCQDGAPTSLHVDHQAILGRATCGASTPGEASLRAKEICDSAAESIRIEPRK